MDIVFLILGALAILTGIVGSVLPVLPGPPVAWLGLLLLHFSGYAQFSTRMLVISAVITILITVLDYIAPAWSTRRFGGTKAGRQGATVGTIAGIFFGPLGIIIGPFIGAFLGEIISHPTEHNRALKVALGSFVGFLFSTGIKLIWSVVIAWWFIRALIAGV